MNVSNCHSVIGYRYTGIHSGFQPVDKLLSCDHAATALYHNGIFLYLAGNFAESGNYGVFELFAGKIA